MKSPGHRFESVKQQINLKRTAPEEPKLRSLYAILTGSRADDLLVEYAYDLYRNTTHRPVVDAFILAKVPSNITADALQVPAEVLDVYAYLFMDTSVFRNVLELRSYAANYNDETVKAAVFTGQEFLLWMYNITQPHVDPRYVIRKTMVDAYMRGQAHRGNGITSQVSKAAHNWMNTAIRNAELLEKLDPQTAREAAKELELALLTNDETLTSETSPVAVEEILH